MRKWKKIGLVPASAAALGSSVALTALLSLAAVPIIMRGWLPLSSCGMCAALAAGLGIFLSVTAVARLRGCQPMQTAGIVCAGFILLHALLCALGGKNCSFGSWIASSTAAAASGAFAGAVMSIRKTGVKRRRKRN